MGGSRAGRRQTTETNLSAGDQEMKIQTKEKRSDSCRAPQLFYRRLRCGFCCAFLRRFGLLGLLLGAFRGELLLYGFA